MAKAPTSAVAESKRVIIFSYCSLNATAFGWVSARWLNQYCPMLNWLFNRYIRLAAAMAMRQPKRIAPERSG
jgi:hypothetical protein